MKPFNILLFALTLWISSAAQAAQEAQTGVFITVASTTSTQNSGLFDHILPQFTAQTGIAVRVVAVGTGQAIRNAKRGDADVLFVHHRPSEEAFVQEGYGIKRFDVMMNDFILVGPTADPAGVLQNQALNAAMHAIANTQSAFVSRGDDSGTHKREQGLWKQAGITPTPPWYREAGAGMGASLNISQAMGAYTLTDRGTWIAFKNKAAMNIVLQGAENLSNPYGVILVNLKRHPHVKAKLGQTFINWLTSDIGQAAIASFTLQGQQLFFPTAK